MNTVNLVCAECGRQFNKNRNEYNRQIKAGKTRFFCKFKCAMVKCGKERRSGEVVKICAWCKKEFTAPDHKWFSKKCCSIKCSNSLNKSREILVWENHIKIKKPYVSKYGQRPNNWRRGTGFTIETEQIRRDKIRKSIEIRYANGWMPKAGRCKKIRYVSSMCGEVLLDGSWELDTAKFLDEKKIKWNRNKIRFEYDDCGKKRHYTPDFYLSDENAYLEVKGYETALDRKKWSQFPHKIFVFRKQEIDLIRKNAPGCSLKYLIGL